MLIKSIMFLVSVIPYVQITNAYWGPYPTVMRRSYRMTWGVGGGIDLNANDVAQYGFQFYISKSFVTNTTPFNEKTRFQYGHIGAYFDNRLFQIKGLHIYVGAEIGWFLARETITIPRDNEEALILFTGREANIRVGASYFNLKYPLRFEFSLPFLYQDIDVSFHRPVFLSSLKIGFEL